MEPQNSPQNEPDWQAPARCSATVQKTGKPCRSWAVADGTMCRKHGMSPQERRAEAQAGAQATNAVVIRRKAEQAAQALQSAVATLPGGLEIDIVKADDFVQTLTRVIQATADGSLAAAKSRAITGLLKLRLDAEQLSISAKLLELEKRMNERRKGGA
jgi:hypothetical protein